MGRRTQAGAASRGKEEGAVVVPPPPPPPAAARPRRATAQGGRAGETVRHISASPRPRSRAIEKPGELGPCLPDCLLFLPGGSPPPAPPRLNLPPTPPRPYWQGRGEPRQRSGSGSPPERGERPPRRRRRSAGKGGSAVRKRFPPGARLRLAGQRRGSPTPQELGCPLPGWWWWWGTGSGREVCVRAGGRD